MSQIFMLPPAGGVAFDSRVSPTMALIALLPAVNLAGRFAGLAPWVYDLPGRLALRQREEYALTTLVVYGCLSHLALEDAHMDSVEALLQHLKEMPDTSLQERVLRGLAEVAGQKDVSVAALRAEPDRLDALLRALPDPTPDEHVELDLDRLAGLLLRPSGLKALLLRCLEALWREHLQPHWEKALPPIRQHVAVSRRHFHAGRPREVFRAVTGRSVPESLAADLFDRLGRIVFCPLPFFGPYCTCAPRPGVLDLWVAYGFGVEAGAQPVGEADPLPGGLLAALEALADETRLQMLALVRDRGQGCAQDFMAELSLSQPATSRHLRLLETTGLLQVERVDGIKWYRINPARSAQVAEAIRAFLGAGGRPS
jgi:DNA-binding transcriptional ArsR family regulator